MVPKGDGRGALPRNRDGTFRNIFAAFPHPLPRVGLWLVSAIFLRAIPVARERAPTAVIRGPSTPPTSPNELNKSTLPASRDPCASMILFLQSKRFD